MKLMIEAFPIIVYQRQLEDGSRKITEIIEGQGFNNGRVEYRTLFKYSVDDNEIKDGKTTVIGHFERVRPISAALQEELLQNGAPKSVLDNLIGFEDDYSGTVPDYQSRQREAILKTMSENASHHSEPIEHIELSPLPDDNNPQRNLPVSETDNNFENQIEKLEFMF